MQDRYEATSEVARRLHPTSGTGDARIELSVHAAPTPVAARLPDHYGIARFELLVVDPEWAFAVWEVSSPAPGAVLQLRFYCAETDGPALAGFNLYGDTGRWFVHAALPGRRIHAALGHAAGTEFREILRRGPLDFPRNFSVESDYFEELQVEYERGPHGQLLLKGLNQHEPQPWPEYLSPAAFPPEPLDWLDGAGRFGPDSSAQHARRGPARSGAGPQTAQGGNRDV